MENKIKARELYENTSKNLKHEMKSKIAKQNIKNLNPEQKRLKSERKSEDNKRV